MEHFRYGAVRYHQMCIRDSGEAKLIYAKDNYVVAAFHGPDGDIGAYFCDADGNRIDDQV